MTVNVVLLFNEHQRYFFFAQTIPRCLVAHFCKMLAHGVASLFASQRVAFAYQGGDMKSYGFYAHFFSPLIAVQSIKFLLEVKN